MFGQVTSILSTNPPKLALFEHVIQIEVLFCAISIALAMVSRRRYASILMLSLELLSHSESFFAHVLDHILPLKCFFLFGWQVAGNIKTYTFVYTECGIRNLSGFRTSMFVQVFKCIDYTD